jgi:hypothetical protein
MTGRSVHDLLLRILSDGALRARLFEGRSCPDGMPVQEWTVLARLSSDRLRRMSQFLARHYYRERIVRLFRHVQTLAPHTGRDPLTILQTPEAQAVMETACLGSSVSAERLLTLIEEFLLTHDEPILMHIPYWRDLVRYHAAMFRCDAGGSTQNSRHPRRADGARIVDLTWDLPAVFVQLRNGPTVPPHADPQPTRLLIARSTRGQVTAVRSRNDIERLLHFADGTRDTQQLSHLVGLSIQHTEHVLQQLMELGAIGWNRDR